MINLLRLQQVCGATSVRSKKTRVKFVEDGEKIEDDQFNPDHRRKGLIEVIRLNVEASEPENQE